MKYFIALGVATFFSSCNSDTKKDVRIDTPTDTSSVVQFKATGPFDLTDQNQLNSRRPSSKRGDKPNVLNSMAQTPRQTAVSPGVNVSTAVPTPTAVPRSELCKTKQADGTFGNCIDAYNGDLEKNPDFGRKGIRDLNFSGCNGIMRNLCNSRDPQPADYYCVKNDSGEYRGCATGYNNSLLKYHNQPTELELKEITNAFIMCQKQYENEYCKIAEGIIKASQ